MPVLSADGGHVAIQTPWELSPGETSITLDIPSDSPFVDSELVNVSTLHPAFEPPLIGSGLPVLTLIKADLSGPVTEQPNAGDIVHLFMTGLGPVQGSPITGLAAPSDALIPLLGTIKCMLGFPTTNLTTVLPAWRPA